MISFPPMMAVSWPRPFDDDEWWFEIKWDGIRVMVEAEPGQSVLRARSGRDVTASFSDLARIEVDRATVIDCEIVAFDEVGVPSFQRLQSRMNRSRPFPGVSVTLVPFDLLYHGVPLLGNPIEERRERLASIDIPGAGLSEPVLGRGVAMFEAAVAKGLEGVVAKRRESRYQPGRRSPDWRKIPMRARVRALVCGYTPGEGGRFPSFGALQLGLWDEGRIRYVGGVGTGFDEAALEAISQTLRQIETEAIPMVGDWPAGTRFVEPVLVAMVEYLSWTEGGRLRGPAFVGFTDDAPEAITWVAEGPGGDSSLPSR